MTNETEVAEVSPMHIETIRAQLAEVNAMLRYNEETHAALSELQRGYERMLALTEESSEAKASS